MRREKGVAEAQEELGTGMIRRRNGRKVIMET